MFGKFKTGNLLSRDFGASPLFVIRGASGLMRRTTPALPSEPVEPAPPLFRTQLKGGTPKELTPKLESRDEWLVTCDW